MDADVVAAGPMTGLLAACETALFWEPRVYRGGARWRPGAPKGLLNVAVIVADKPGSPVIGEMLLRVAKTLVAIPRGKRPNPVYSTGPSPAAKAIHELRAAAATAHGYALDFVNGTETLRARAATSPGVTMTSLPKGAPWHRQVCEFDDDEARHLFEHKFFCTYCDRGPKFPSRAARETVDVKKAAPGFVVTFPRLRRPESC